MPRHPKAKEFAKSGLFAGVTSFAELEKRIAAIPENKGKGDAFEVFAEGYLATLRKHEVAEAWPLDAVPVDLLKKRKFHTLILAHLATRKKRHLGTTKLFNCDEAVSVLATLCTTSGGARF